MAIVKPPVKPTQAPVAAAAIERFIEGAPDAAKAPAGAAADSDMTMITLRISKADLALIDRAAKERRIARAAFIRQAVFQVMQADG